MEIDMAALLAAVVEQEGGAYTLTLAAFERVLEMENKTLQLDLGEDQKTIDISIVDLPEDTEEIVG